MLTCLPVFAVEEQAPPQAHAEPVARDHNGGGLLEAAPQDMQTKLLDTFTEMMQTQVRAVQQQMQEMQRQMQMCMHTPFHMVQPMSTHMPVHMQTAVGPHDPHSGRPFSFGINPSSHASSVNDAVKEAKRKELLELEAEIEAEEAALLEMRKHRAAKMARLKADLKF